DRDLDSYNPRTSRRPLVTGEADPLVVVLLIVFFSLAFLLSALYFNWLAFFLSFPILAAEVSYPFAKRVHCFPHLHLGAILGASPLAGAIAISGSLEGLPWGYSIALALWVSGFDVIYSLQDIEFDRRFGVRSIPACLGESIALNSASIMHISSFLVLLLTSTIGLISMISIISYGVLLLIENVKARRGEYREAFDLNIVIGLFLGLGIMLDYLVQ
ncbi:MAG: 4-hydroxybenzoate octaprenyltransferase, partial [Candidatus Korarchaeum sp.]|nr:4-hydroxybenzoate octaprenyltransferase [Candidatus Korarchaeum sp.]MDW8036354.1 4-hydroxybenzoate octaprenyltransferase [Candidatus Korarchaeum sp.]